MIAILFSASSVFGQNEYSLIPRKSDYVGPWREGPSILFDTTKVKQKLIRGERGTFVYSFVNDGTEPLIISIVKSSCGCLVPSYPKDIIYPGYRCDIVGSLNTDGRVGPVHKTMTVASNAIDSQIVLHVMGQIDTVATQSVPAPPFSPYSR